MTDVKITVEQYGEALKAQRNAALDEAALLRAQVQAMSETINDLEAQLKGVKDQLVAKIETPVVAKKRGRKNVEPFIAKSNGAVHEPDEKVVTN